MTSLKIETPKLSKQEKELVKKYIKKLKSPENSQSFNTIKKAAASYSKALNSALKPRRGLGGIFDWAGNKIDEIGEGFSNVKKKYDANPFIQKQRMDMQGINSVSDFKKYNDLTNGSDGKISFLNDFMKDPVAFRKSDKWGGFANDLNPTQRSFIENTLSNERSYRQAERTQRLKNNLPYIGIGAGTGLGALALSNDRPKIEVTKI